MTAWDREGLAAKSAAAARNKVRAELRQQLPWAETDGPLANPAQAQLPVPPGQLETQPRTKPNRKAQAA